MNRRHHLTQRDIVQAMPGTVREIARRSGYHHDTVVRHLAELRIGSERLRRAHIGAWFEPEDGRTPAPIWHAGPGRHRAEPKRRRQTNAERWARAKEIHGLPALNDKYTRNYHLRQRRAAGPANPFSLLGV
jgi:hypothetical protein